MIYITDNLEFHLSNGKISYIFRVMEKTNILEQLYFGKYVDYYEHYDFLIEREIRTGNNLVEGDYLTSLEHIKQEMPVYGTTDFRYPALEVSYPEGDNISQFEYHSHRVSKGKQKVKGFPSSFAFEDEVEVLTIILKDKYSELFLEADYCLYSNFPIITRQNRMVNKGKEQVILKNIMSLNLDILNNNYEWIHLDGAWARERHLKRNIIQSGVQNISSTRGASSHTYNPFMAIMESNATEHYGEVFGVSLIYSGNFLAQIERDNFEILRIQIGINPFQFAWKLEPNHQFVTPEALLSYTTHGLNEMSQVFHEFIKRHIIDSKWKIQPRPILINNWEATYFNFDEDKIMEIAKIAKDVGIDLFVLDDGWFENRDNDNGSLGNWKVDKRKLPNGLNHLSKKLHDIGLQFGLWIEPEMVSKNTKLYQTHPEWVIGNPNKNISHGRNQYVLNFAIPEVVDAIFKQLDDILSITAIEYIKWDMNRYISEAYSTWLSPDRQGELFHRYILGVYSLYEKIIEKYPNVMIESCAGGGGRFDLGMLYYSPQIWASDNTDAIERLKIQYGTSMIYPLSAIGAHVSEVPNHQVGRTTSLKTRSNVAMFGTFGFELDITKLNSFELSTIKDEVDKFKTFQQLIHTGIFYRLSSPFENDNTAWMVVSKDRNEALVGIYEPMAKPNHYYRRLKLQGLDSHKKYHYQLFNRSHMRYGRDLLNIGLLLNDNFISRANEYWSQEKQGDYASWVIHLTAE